MVHLGDLVATPDNYDFCYIMIEDLLLLNFSGRYDYSAWLFKVKSI
jgi:hypothetical protein